MTRDPFPLRAGAAAILGASLIASTAGCAGGGPVLASKARPAAPLLAVKRAAPGGHDAPGGRASAGGLMAMAALDDHQLGRLRGGFDTGAGPQLSFGFQQTTYVNGSQLSNYVQPTITFARNADTNSFVPTAMATPTSTSPLPLPTGANGTPTLVLTGGGAGQPFLGVPASTTGSAPSYNWSNLGYGPAAATTVAPASATLPDTGATSVTTLLGGGLTNTVANTANNQLVQQVTKVDISAMGFNGFLQGARATPSLDALRTLQFVPR